MNNSLVYKNHLLRIDDITNETAIYNNMGILKTCLTLNEAKTFINAMESGPQLLYQLKKAVDIIGNDDRIMDMVRLIERIENETN